MFFYFLLYGNFFLLLSCIAIQYNGIIQLNIKPNPFVMKKDLEIIEQYKHNANIANDLVGPIITHVNDNLEQSGLGIYEHKKNPYQELHYEVAKKLLEANLQGITGIFGHYRGYSVMSDKNGNIVFPRLDDSNSISIVITENIVPVIIHGAVPDHFVIDYYAKYASYVAENIEKAPNAPLMKWGIKEDSSLIINKKIPYQAIVIIANPDLFFFDSNVKPVDYSINILLPTLYALQENSISQYSNLAMQTLQYFKQFNITRYSSEIENQLHEGIILK